MVRKLSRRFLLGGIAGGSLAAPALAAPALAAPALAAPDRAAPFRDGFLGAGEWLAYRAQRLIGGDALAPEFTEADTSPVFRTNGNTLPASAAYRAHAAAGFADWRLRVDGQVVMPRAFSLQELRAMPSRTQITLHNCVEGWSAVGKWRGTVLGGLLREVGLRPSARYIVFHCADDFDGTPYYESVDLDDAFHPQTILAYDMNDAPLAIGHGAPIRVRIERQLGYKHAKFVMRIEAVESLRGIGRGKGGFWEDEAGYYWYAGI
jgi:DMSO/TMAO reductase YedYZ molybdopterin-dependent catalytic subunit